MINIKVILKDNKLKIYINKLLHLNLLLTNFIGFQSYKENNAINKYFIKYYYKNGVNIRTEYDTIQKWVAILKQLEIIF